MEFLPKPQGLLRAKVTWQLIHKDPNLCLQSLCWLTQPEGRWGMQRETGEARGLYSQLISRTPSVCGRYQTRDGSQEHECHLTPVKQLKLLYIIKD